MRKFKVLYPTRIMDKIYKEGETVEFSPGTDRNFISRLQMIKAIVEIPEEDQINDLDSDIDEVNSQEKKQKNKKQK
ncbi:hypothetical protein [Campylobacter pinnipediorum]|uniref:hypothetical protein n=1 Tax=Campylobacter pinnipediorum TaxID=1965231 RepID=UPI00099558AA|nr:hypothetical protein [Campylobacter pinnipediorum]AQW82914.1 hypothetical protein CPIN17261_0905 [Campylobacter pinnipediorum subsp. pinnipediorum]